MTQIKASNFSNRSDLENEVRKLVELSPDLKPTYEISGTRKELEILHLSDETIFYGIKCVITDFPSVVKAQKEVERPQRGEIKPIGLNGNLKEIKK